MVYLPDIRISTTNFYRLLVLTVSPYVLHQILIFPQDGQVKPLHEVECYPISYADANHI